MLWFKKKPLEIKATGDDLGGHDFDDLEKYYTDGYDKGFLDCKNTLERDYQERVKRHLFYKTKDVLCFREQLNIYLDDIDKLKTEKEIRNYIKKLRKELMLHSNEEFDDFVLGKFLDK